MVPRHSLASLPQLSYSVANSTDIKKPSKSGKTMELWEQIYITSKRPIAILSNSHVFKVNCSLAWLFEINEFPKINSKFMDVRLRWLYRVKIFGE
jgi:hypothetical protein